MTSPHIVPALLATLLLVATAACTSQSAAERRPGTPADTSLRFVFAEQIGGETAIWSARPDAPADRRRLARVRHHPDWGIRAALSPDGRYLAYTALPPGGRDPDRGAQLIVLDLQQRRSRRLLSGLDLRTVPLWTRDAARVIVQRVLPSGGGSLIALTPAGEEQLLHTAAPNERLAPVASEPAGGSIYVAVVSPDAVSLRSIDPGGGAHQVRALGTAPSRGFTLSPDGASLAFLRIESVGGERRYRAHALDLARGAVVALYAEMPRDEDTGVGWPPGSGPVVTASRFAEAGGSLFGEAPWRTRSRDGGFDAVTGASPDGRWLVLRAFQGGTSRAPGPETLVLLDTDGVRHPVTAGGGVTAIGWRRG